MSDSRDAALVELVRALAEACVDEFIAKRAADQPVTREDNTDEHHDTNDSPDHHVARSGHR